MAKAKAQQPKQQKQKQQGMELSLHHPYDKAARFAAKKGGPHFVRMVFARLKKRIKIQPDSDTRTQTGPQSPERICDLVYLLFDPHKPNIIQLANIEVQLFPVGNEFGRGKEYSSRLSLERNHPSRRPEGKEVEAFNGFLFLTGKRPILKGKTNLAGTGAGSADTMASVALAEFNAREFLAKIKAKKLHHSLLYWVPFMEDADQPDVILEWMRLVIRFVDYADQGDMKTVALTFAEKVGRKTAWLDTLKEWIVPESLLLKQWTKEAVTKAEHKVLANQLFKYLQKRLSATISPELRARIQQEQNLDVLEGWLDEAYISDSFASFLQKTGLQ